MINNKLAMTHEKFHVEKVPGIPVVPLKKVFLFACYSCLPAGLCDIPRYHDPLCVPGT